MTMNLSRCQQRAASSVRLLINFVLFFFFFCLFLSPSSSRLSSACCSSTCGQQCAPLAPVRGARSQVSSPRTLGTPSVRSDRHRSMHRCGNSQQSVARHRFGLHLLPLGRRPVQSRASRLLVWINQSRGCCTWPTSDSIGRMLRLRLE